MDWENERYVRLYTRSTVDDSVLTWEARALWHELLRKFDRSGVIDLGRHGTKGISALVGIPLEVVAGALDELVEDGRVSLNLDDKRLLAPNFLEAQEAKQSDKLRQARSRESRRAMSQNVTDCHDSSHGVTNGHDSSRCVTPSLAEPNQTSLAVSLAQSPLERFDFESVYADYPRKQGKAKGLTAARRIITTQEDFERFTDCITFMARAFRSKDSRQFCPHFSTFVNAKSWRDEEWPGSDRVTTSPGKLTPAQLLDRANGITA